MTIRSRFVQVDGIRTHYLEAGEGRPVLLLHSGEFGGCAELSWEFSIPSLAERYRVLAPDWLGYGQTDKLYDFGGGQARMVQHLRRFIEVLELGGSHVVGTSMGGSLFAKALAAAPQSFDLRSLALISSGGFTPDNEHRRAMMDYDGTPEGMRAMLRGMFEDPKWSEAPDYVRRRVELSIRPGAWEAVAASRFKSPVTPPRELFGRPDETVYENIVVPTLVIAGKQDKLRLDGYAEELAGRLPQAELHVLDGCGHCPQIERASDVNRILLSFFERLDSPKSRRPDAKAGIGRNQGAM